MLTHFPASAGSGSVAANTLAWISDEVAKAPEVKHTQYFEVLGKVHSCSMCSNSAGELFRIQLTCIVIMRAIFQGVPKKG